jgi:hypothetical protein
MEKARLMHMQEIRRYQVYRLQRAPKRAMITRLRRVLRLPWFR